MMRFEKFLGKMKGRNRENKKATQPVKNQPNIPKPEIPKLNDLSLSIVIKCPYCQEQVEILETDFDIGFIEFHADRIVFTFHPGSDIVCEK